MAFSINAINTNRAEIADIIGWRKGKRIENMISAINSTVSKVGLALCSFAIGMTLEINGYSSELAVQSQGTISAIEAFMGIVPMLTAALMLVVALRVRIEDSVRIMNREKEGK